MCAVAFSFKLRAMYKSSNPIQDWYTSEERIQQVIDTLSSSGLTEEEQAKAAFDQVADAYDLPKYPQDFTDAHYERFSEQGVENPRSVFEENTILSYLEPEDDPRGIVILALYNVHHGIQIPLNECAKKHFGGKRKIPKEYMVCFIGETIYGKLHFMKDGESWTEMGARSAMKIIN